MTVASKKFGWRARSTFHVFKADSMLSRESRLALL